MLGTQVHLKAPFFTKMQKKKQMRAEPLKRSSAPILSVAVCTYNRPQMLEDCLQSLFAQSIDPKQFEILVIDNNSPPATKELVLGLQKKQSKHNIRYYFEARQGVSYARNLAIREARGSYLAYMDDDHTVIADWCRHILASFEKVRPQPAVVGGPVLNVYPWGKAPHFDEAMLAPANNLGRKSDFLDKLTGPQRGFGTGNCAMSLDILRRYPEGFSVALGRKGTKAFGSEDAELFMRMRQDGHIFWYGVSMISYHRITPDRTYIFTRFRRGLYEGMSSAHMDKDRIKAIALCKICVYAACIAPFVILSLFRHPLSFKKRLNGRAMRAGEHIGYFLGTLKELWRARLGKKHKKAL